MTAPLPQLSFQQSTLAISFAFVISLYLLLMVRNISRKTHALSRKKILKLPPLTPSFFFFLSKSTYFSLKMNSHIFKTDLLISLKLDLNNN